VIWPNCGFSETDCDESELKKISYDLILVTTLWCHRKTNQTNVTRCFPFWATQSIFLSLKPVYTRLLN